MNDGDYGGLRLGPRRTFWRPSEFVEGLLVLFVGYPLAAGAIGVLLNVLNALTH
jgi:hypothetical protein